MANNDKNNKGADSLILGVSLDTSQAQQDAQDLGNQLEKVSNSIGDKSVKSFKQQLKEAKDEALKLASAGDTTSAAYRKAVSTIADLKDQQDVLNRSVQAYDPGNKFQAVSKVASLAANSIGGMTGAMTLLGVSSDTANEAIAKLQSIEAIVGLLDAWGDSVDFLQPFLQRLGLLKTVTTEVAVAQKVATVATEGQAVATEGLTIAQNTANASSKALKIGLASIGIGLIVAAVGYLVANWDNLKTSITSLMPDLSGTGELLNKLKNIAIGVGSVVVNYLVAPVKTLAKLLSGDFKGAINEFKKGTDVVGNFKKGQQLGELNDQNNFNKLKLENDLKTSEQKLKILKASGAETEKLERDILNKKLQINKNDKEAYKELLNEKAVFEATASKKRKDEADKDVKEAAAKAKAVADKNKQEREQQLKELKKYNDDAKKILAQSNLSDREKAINDIQAKYKAEIDLATKLGKSKVDLENAQQAEIAGVNKKYSDEINDYFKTKSTEKLTEFDKQRKQINDEIEKLKKNATPEDVAKLENEKNNQLGKIDNIEKATNSSEAAKDNLTRVENSNEEDEKDAPEIAKQKIANIKKAEMDAEMESYNLKKLQLIGNQTELENLESEHQLRLLTITSTTSAATKKISEAEAKSKIDNINMVANIAGQAASVFGDHTIAYKALASAQAAISTYTSAQEAYKSMVGIPVVGPALAAVAAGVAVAGGLANIAKINSVKVPKVKDASKAATGVTAPTFTAPVINSTILKQNDNGINNLTETISSKQNEPIRAFVVEDDLNKKQQKTELYKQLSTI